MTTRPPSSPGRNIEILVLKWKEDDSIEMDDFPVKPKQLHAFCAVLNHPLFTYNYIRRPISFGCNGFLI
jgi:hypothetical protein